MNRRKGAERLHTVSVQAVVTHVTTRIDCQTSVVDLKSGTMIVARFGLAFCFAFVRSSLTYVLKCRLLQLRFSIRTLESE